MSLNDLDLNDREFPGPLDILAAVQTVIDDHIPRWSEKNWNGGWICDTCWARLTEREARTHTAQQLWERGLLA